MMVRRRILDVFLILSMALPQDAGRYPTTPIEVVRLYCDFDLKTGRISTTNFAKLPPLVTWEAEPGWDTVTVVSSFKILSAKQSQDRAVVTVKWDVLGHAEGENVTKDKKSEVIDYQLRLVKGSGKIEAPVIPPHVSLPTLRACVQSEFQYEPKRQALWIGNLDALGKSVLTAPASDRCSFPTGLSDEISRKYPSTRLVRFAYLDEYDGKLFRKDHGIRCPGLVRVNFYGDSKPTWSLVLISGEDTKRKAQLVVARQLADGWETRLLETTDATPLVSRERPGKYEGMSDPKTILATNPVIVFCGYGSWAILYAWTGKEVAKTWISD